MKNYGTIGGGRKETTFDENCTIFTRKAKNVENVKLTFSKCFNILALGSLN